MVGLEVPMAASTVHTPSLSLCLSAAK